MDSSPLRFLPELFSSAPHAPAASHRAIRRGAHGRLASPVPLSAGTHDNVARLNRTSPQTTSRFTPGRSIRGTLVVLGGSNALGRVVAWFGSPNHLPPFGICFLCGYIRMPLSPPRYCHF